MRRQEKIKCPRCGFECTRNEFDKGTVFNFVTEKHVEMMILFLKNASPNVMGLILGQMNREVAARILSELPEEVQTDVVKVIGELTAVELKTVQKLDDVLEQKLNAKSETSSRKFDGIKSAADLLYASTHDTQNRVLDELAEDFKISHSIIREIFIETIAQINDKKLIDILQKASTKVIAAAIKGANERARLKIRKSLPNRRQEILNDEIQEMPYKIHIKVINNAQREIMEIVHEMAEKD